MKGKNRYIFIYFSLLMILLCSCGEDVGTRDITHEQKDYFIETEYKQKIVFTAKNDEKDLIVESNKILAVKEKSTFYSIALSNIILEIGSEAFQCCMQLEWIDISHAVKQIGESAFYKCTSLRTVVIKNPVIEIGLNAFEDCFLLQTVYFLGDFNQWKKATENCGECFYNVEIICCESAGELNVCFLAKE